VGKHKVHKTLVRDINISSEGGQQRTVRPESIARRSSNHIAKQIFTVYNDAANLFKYWFFLSLMLAGDAFNFLEIARAANT
jgi:hypothetical protein